MGYRAILLLSLGTSVFGCGDDENGEEATISVSVSEQLVVSWDGGGVGSLQVRPCESPVTSCPDLIGCRGSVTTEWGVNSFPRTDNPIISPQEYGAPVLMSSGASKDDLQPGRTYSLTVVRYRECDPPDEGCVNGSEAGCTVFVP